MEFRKLRIKDLIPASYNPRKKLKPEDKEFEKIKNSITEFGYVEPIIVNSDMTIIGGNQRAKVHQTCHQRSRQTSFSVVISYITPLSVFNLCDPA